MKRIRKGAAVFVMALLVMTAGCGGRETLTAGKTAEPGAEELQGKTRNKTASENHEKTGAEAGQEDALSVGICIYRFDDEFMTLYREELKNYLISSYKIPEENIKILDGKGDQAEQTEQIEKLIEDGVDVLLLNLVEPSQAQSITDRCSEAGIPAVFINREPEEEELARWEHQGIAASYVGADARLSGTYQGEIILDTPDKGDLNGDGVVSYVMLMGDPENIDARHRSEYSIKALEDAGMKTESLSMERGDWEEEKGRSLTEKALSKFGRRIEVIFCNNDAMANGARTALLEAGRVVGKDVYLVGVDALEETVGYIKEGTVTGTVLNDHVGQSHTAADVAVKMASGEKVQKKYTVDYIKIAMKKPAGR